MVLCRASCTGTFLALIALFSCRIDGLPEVSHNPVPPLPPIHLILFIGDGMGLPSENLASRYLYGQEQALAWNAFPKSGWVSTWDVTAYNKRADTAGKAHWNAADLAANDPLVGYAPATGGQRPWPLNLQDGIADNLAWLKYASTDSASAATAMACGVKTDTGNIAWAPGDTAEGALESIGTRLANERGMKYGVISTVPISHATPAAFGAHSTSRSTYTEIARQLMEESGVSVLIGGGHPDFDGGWISPQLLAEAKISPAWKVAERKTGMDGDSSLQKAFDEARADSHILGLFGGADGAFEAPLPAESPGAPNFTRNTANPSLDHAVWASMAQLSRTGNGFFLMVEQGDIDWANHSNTLPRMIGAMASLDQAVRSAVDYVNLPGDSITEANTLILVTADHATGAIRYDSAAAPVAGSLAIPGLVFNSKGHTNELVGIHAWGGGAALLDNYKGREYPGTDIISNTDIYKILLQFATSAQ